MAQKEFTHYVHLANGEVVPFTMKDNDPRPAAEVVGNDYVQEDGNHRTVHRVIGVYPREHGYDVESEDE